MKISSVKEAYFIQGDRYKIPFKTQQGEYILTPIGELSSNELKEYAEKSILSDIYNDIVNDIILKRRINLLNKIKNNVK